MERGSDNTRKCFPPFAGRRPSRLCPSPVPPCADGSIVLESRPTLHHLAWANRSRPRSLALPGNHDTVGKRCPQLLALVQQDETGSVADSSASTRSEYGPRAGHHRPAPCSVPPA